MAETIGSNKMIWALLIGGVGYYLWKKNKDKQAQMLSAMNRGSAPEQKKAGGFGGGGGGSAPITPTTPIIAGTQTSGNNNSGTPEINIDIQTPTSSGNPAWQTDPDLQPADAVAAPANTTTSGFVDFDGDFDYMSKGDWKSGRSKTDFDGEFN